MAIYFKRPPLCPSNYSLYYPDFKENYYLTRLKCSPNRSFTGRLMPTFGTLMPANEMSMSANRRSTDVIFIVINGHGTFLYRL
jgi:hypothetical protein